MKLNFPFLTAEDVTVKMDSFNQYGCELVIYKDSRVDCKILDKTVGPMNWRLKRSPDLKACTIGIFDEEKNDWVDKTDVGEATGMQHADKAIASDALKRSAFLWGIGRELYNIPKIYISREMEYDSAKRRYVPKNWGDPRYKGLKVSELVFDKRSSKCKRIVIVNASGAVIYEYDDTANKKAQATQPVQPNQPVPDLSFESQNAVNTVVPNSSDVPDPAKDLQGYVAAKGGYSQ
jgi:hypothetical protein